MNNNTIPSVIIEPDTKKVTASVILLHGLGANGNDFSPLVSQLSTQNSLGLRFIFPHAPERPVSINGGYIMRAWYDITSQEFIDHEDNAGIRNSERTICQLIQHEITYGIDTSRIVLAGFSQGGAIALHTGLRYPKRLAGILALSTYLPLAKTLPDERHSANNEIDIMMAHGTCDNIVPISLAQRSCRYLLDSGYRVGWHTYPMGHEVCKTEIEDIDYWLKQKLA